MELVIIFKNYGVLNKKSQAERLYNMSFNTAGILISKMDTFEKAALASEIEVKTLSLYTEASKVDSFIKVPGIPYPVPELSMDAYMFIMGMIKRYEILLDYVFEIGALIEKDRLQQKIRETEELLRELQLEELVIENNNRKTSSAKLDSYRADEQACNPQTSAIHEMAKGLTAKFFS